jgi:hypothetical protein
VPTYTTAEINAALVSPRRRWRFKYFIVDTTAVYETKDVVECRLQCNYLAQGANRTCDVVFGPNVEFDQLRQAFRPVAQLVMPPVVITDDFQGATNADMNGRLTTTGGKTWVANGGTWSIFGNGGRHSNTTPGNLTVDTGEADGTWQIDFYTATDLAYSGIRFRDNGGGQNYQLKTDGSTWHFQHDGVTDIGVTAPGTVTTNTWYYLRIVLAGHRVKIYINDVLTFDHTGTDLNYTTGTKVGLQAFNATTPLWDNFRWVGVAEGYAEWVLGTFRLSASTLRVAGTPSDRPQKLDGYDLLIDYQETKILDRYVVAAGANPVSAAKTLSGLITSSSIGSVYYNAMSAPPTVTTLPAPMEWPPGTSYLTIINDLLASVNYTSLTITANGQPVSVPYVPPESSTTVWTYRVDRDSVIIPGVDTELDLFNVPNVWVGYVSEPDRPALRSVARNDDPSSATSTLSRGREIVQLVDTSTLHLTEQTGPSGNLPAATQADLDALVLRARSESSTIYEQVKMSTGLMPFHGVGDAVGVDYGAGLGNYREVSWSMELRAGGQMTHELRRAVTL